MEHLIKQYEIVKRELELLGKMLTEPSDSEASRLSMLVSGTPDLHIRNPDLFAQMRPYADENKPPFTLQGWQMTMHMGSDTRMTYDQIAEFENNNPNAPWDSLIKDG